MSGLSRIDALNSLFRDPACTLEPLNPRPEHRCSWEWYSKQSQGSSHQEILIDSDLQRPLSLHFGNLYGKSRNKI